MTAVRLPAERRRGLLVPGPPGGELVATTVQPPTHRRRGLLVHTILPVTIGGLAAVAIGAEGGTASAVMMCAAIYLAAAVIGRPNAAWWSFAAGLPLIGLGAVLDNEWVTLVVLGLAQAVLFVVGLRRGSWTQRHNRRQLGAAVGFGTLAVVIGAATAGGGFTVIASALVIAGLVGHALWDSIHHHRDVVVSRSYSAFCAGLDAALAVVVIISILA
ncbi:hypothetical protein ABZS29_36065 [Kribbella sp. NPDC005582]|uniref:hypothetical protein n=1 Tax=Kribbella sp. NPDC005582 TaxID=3156893 RepID=UPI0033B0479D